MADIDVVSKKKTSLWLWIIAAIVVAMILFMLLGNAADVSGGVSELMRRPAPAVVAGTA